MKKDGRKIRSKREEVMAHLLELFEKHQYYAFKDLQAKTQQPEVLTLKIL